MKMLYYIKTSDSEQRSNLMYHFINAGYEVESAEDRAEFFKTDLPIWVDLSNKKYGVVGNVTCAAAAASQDLLIEYSEFIKIFTEYIDEQNKTQIENKLKEAESRRVPGRYYLLEGELVAKRTLGDLSEDLVFANAGWNSDNEGFLAKELSKGRDDCEISEDEAMRIITDQAINYLISDWKEKYDEAFKEWEKAPKWWAKLVETRFVMNGVEKSLVSDHMGWSDGFFESIQYEIESDLERHGAVITGSFGMMD